ncbi:hypothetical protein DR950_17780 [Kitasatospora xanthocidica]|uniref:Uncharacterized protein n=1 Tax=Kitasatospora xanthocidica TaxID=83382 RepID=A0A372ZV73_9ACTN|nr:hypothetical protein [Kitasatospora xanthocidica]RGD59394.1 hypothetical protein DR950_17780 [Kitasatospora xanthocidica]
MTFAPLPTHPRVTDPDWQARYKAFGPLISALRRRDFVTDITFDGDTEAITAELPDGSYLRIDTGDEIGDLPDDIDAAIAWRTIRDSGDNPTVRDTVYDSTPDGPDFLNGALLSPLLVAIDTYLGARGIALLTVTDVHPVVVTVTTIHDHGPAAYEIRKAFPIASREAARYAWAVAQSLPAGFTQQHLSPDWPRYVLADRDRTRVVQATLAELAYSSKATHGPCVCRFTHPQTREEEDQLGQQIADGIKIGDAHGVYLASLRLFTAPQCPARTANARG